MNLFLISIWSLVVLIQVQVWMMRAA